MTELYGQFYDALEEMNERNNPFGEDAYMDRPMERTRWDNRMLNHFFKTMERLNLSQYESSESLVSHGSTSAHSLHSLNRNDSKSSVASGTDSDAEPVFTFENVFQAVQKLSLNSYTSTGSLASLDDESNNNSNFNMIQRENLNVPDFMKNVFLAFEEFMQNHQRVETDTDVDEPITFPKFC